MSVNFSNAFNPRRSTIVVTFTLLLSVFTSIDPSQAVPGGTQSTECVIGATIGCPATSAQEIYNLYGTTANGIYYIKINGVATAVYALMTRTGSDNGAWVLLMKAAGGSTNFGYDSAVWTDATTTFGDISTPSNDVSADVKYSAFNSLPIAKMLAVFKAGSGNYVAGTYGIPNGGDIPSNAFGGHVWNETLTAGPWTAQTRLTTNAQLNSSNAATSVRKTLFMQSQTDTPTYTVTTTSPVNQVFSYEIVSGWYGFSGGPCTAAAAKVRWGLNWNENALNDFTSCDAFGGIGSSTGYSATDEAPWPGTGAGQGAYPAPGTLVGHRSLAFQIWGKVAEPSLNAVQSLAATITGTTASVTWSAPSGVSPTDYVVQYKTTGSSNFSNSFIVTGQSTATVTGLTAGISYDFRVIARTASDSTALANIASVTAIGICSATNSTTVGQYSVLTFQTVGSCNWTIPSSISTVDVFIVGGGGGGGADGGAGGGGGAIISRSALSVTSGASLVMFVGSGGDRGVYNSNNGRAGDSTTVTSGATTLTAGGGGGGITSPVALGTGAGVRGVASNGFSGGLGGTPTTANNTSGGNGAIGATNYFSGNAINYAGGGGGGVYSAVARSGGLGTYGGGNGAVNTGAAAGTGTSGTDGTGGGGGGGAAGTPITSGGRGGSGVVIIRYTTTAAWQFPSTIASKVYARYQAGDLQANDTSRMSWVDSSGNNRSGVMTGATAPTLTTVATGNAATQSNLAANGTTGTVATLADLTAVPGGYTLFHVARYSGVTKRRIFSASGGGWASGFWNGVTGISLHNNWLTQYSTNVTAAQTDWLLSTDQKSFYRANGITQLNNVNPYTTYSGFGINKDAETSDWQALDVIVVAGELSKPDIRLMESYLTTVYGLATLNTNVSIETDTALATRGSGYLSGPVDAAFDFNDTFTVQAWVKPDAECQSGNVECVVMGREATLRVMIYNGTLMTLLYDGSGWEWVDSGVKFPTGEWHHVAVVKDGVGNTNGSLKVYKDGQLVFTKAGSPYYASTSSATYDATKKVANRKLAGVDYFFIGVRLNLNYHFYGSIDEFKLWRVARTPVQVLADTQAEQTSALLNDPTLQLYYDFNKRSSDLVIENLATSTANQSDLVINSSPPFTDVKSVTTSGAYTVTTFPKSYINAYGGWKVPTGVSGVSGLVVGGGGGGGFNTGGGGSGGGFLAFNRTEISGTVKVQVGVGGKAAFPLSVNATDGGLSNFGDLFTANGGNKGLNYVSTGGLGGASVSGSTGSGAGGNGATTKDGFAGAAGPQSSITGTTTSYSGGGGGGAMSTSGVISSGAVGGAGGAGGGGAGEGKTTAAFSGSANTGGGGGGGAANNTSAGYGGSGVVIVRWITASVPTYTKPTTAYLNAGMTETFTTNVPVDSATAQLTRTFVWESSTAGAGGPFTRIKSGTGAANAAFSWVPPDTSTSGSNYLYRLIVTDSDTAGLFITDSSTAFAVINPALLMSGTSTIKKTINVTRNENYTISQGTPTYRYSLLPVISGITLDTSTAGTAILKISDTVTVGSYLETLTVTDSVTGTVVIPLTITVSAPPSLTAGGEIVANGQVLNLDAGNSQSILLGDSAVATSRVWNDLSGNQKNATTSTTVNSTTCNPPTYSTSNGGILTFNSAGSTCYATPYLGSQFAKSYTIETWFKLNSATLPSGTQILGQQYTGAENISFAIGDITAGDGKLRVGFFDGGTWRYATGINNGYTPTQNVWVHIAGTYDGSYLRTYINGALFSESAFTGGVGAVNTKGILIGKRWDLTYYVDGSVGEVRAYNRPLATSEISQNYNATKYRYLSSNDNFLKPSQKYGSLNLESFTVSAGGDTKTVSFQVGNRTGITWDTATAGVVNLSVLSSLPVGTYYDTVTVTDNFSASTYLPIKFTVTKADTITVTTTLSSNSVTYNEAPANVTVTHTATGLVNSETLTATSSYTVNTCEYGGTCAIGDIAPGGGYVFHVSATPINVATGISTGGIYLATAPRTWGGTAADPTASWGCSGTNVSGTSSAVGSGAENTRLINAACATAGIASRLAADSSAEGFTDWFVPSIGELNLMRSNLKVNSLSNLDGINYWSSTQDATNPTTSAQYQWFTGGSSGPTDKNNSAGSNMYVRPIRAFSPTSLASNTSPTDAGTYRVGGSYSLSAPASLSNYLGIESVTATLTINKARQRALSIGQYEAYPNISSYPLNVYGGSGPGVLTATVTAPGSANCTLPSNFIITATNVGTCTVKAEKAGTRNYIVESTTAVITWITWSSNYATQSPGGSHAIPLNGGNQIIVRTETVTASAFSDINGNAITGASPNTPIRINSTGFAGLTPSQITATFRPYEDGTVTAVTSTYVQVTVPSSGAVTGVIALDSPRGVAYTPSFTISP